ncbi:DNA polymerase III subunit alpha [Persicobacter psychrovividus]
MLFHCHTFFSFRYGLLSPEMLVQELKAKGYTSFVLTDINNTSAVFEVYREALKQGLKMNVGIEFRRNGQWQYTAVAKSATGFRIINEHLTAHQHCNSFPPLFHEEVLVIFPMNNLPERALTANEFISFPPEQVHRWPSLKHLHPYREHLLMGLPITFSAPKDRQLHRLLCAIDQNVLLSKLDKSRIATTSAFPIPKKDYIEYYASMPDVVQQSQELLSMCTLHFDLEKPRNKRFYTCSDKDDMALLRKLTYDGFAYRYSKNDRYARARVEKELRVIEQLKMGAYFLITWDMLRYAGNCGFYHVGRGSGANSIVAYCLKITDVDPVELNLYFERFINPYRSSPPDFDIDFSWDERDQILDYLFKRYGKDHVALMACYNTFKAKSLIRELGKVFGLPKGDIDCMIDEPNKPKKHHEMARKIYRYAHRLQGIPNHLSIHAGGVLISEAPITCCTPLLQMPKGFPIVHFDMHVAEDIGYYKFDVLSQRGLGHIKECVKLVQENLGVSIDVHDIQSFKKDERIKHNLKIGKTIGCFYIESPAMRQLLQKLSCDNYVSLVAASSIIRPGVAKSGMMKTYIERAHHPEKVQYLHPVFEEHLGETYGVMVYQEDVIKIAHHFAGISLDEADILRRAMSGKTRSKTAFQELQDQFFANCQARGHARALSEEVWRQMESFSGYSFCKAHSASFAVESYQSLFLKTYYPLEFMVAVINNFGGFYFAELYLHEARLAGANIHAPCINRSSWLTSIRQKDIYIGFVHIKSINQKLIQEIITEREQKGPFRSLADFTSRVAIGREQLELLIRIDAFRFTGHSPQQLQWKKGLCLRPNKPKVATGLLFASEMAQEQKYELPTLEQEGNEGFFEQLDLLGFPLSSPFDILRTSFRGDFPAIDLVKYQGQTVRMLGYYITRKPVRTVKGEIMNFGSFIDAWGYFFDSCHFPPSLQHSPFQGRGCYLIKGKVVVEFGFPTVEVEKMVKLPQKADPRY